MTGLALGDTPNDLRATAERWAPVLYQDVADGPLNDPDMRRRDLLTAVDFDGSLDPFDSVENADGGDFPLRPAVYYDAVETETTIYLLYSLFHPIDWNELGFVDHENDMEHAWLVVEKHADGTQSLLVAHTQAHGEFFGWSDAELSGHFELTDGGLSMEGDHVRLFIEAHGHGPASCSHAGGLPFTQAIDCDPSSDEDLVIYRVVDGADVADLDEPDVSTGGVVESGYALVSAYETLWPYRTYLAADEAEPPLWDEPWVYAPGRNADADPTNDLAQADLPAFGADFAGDEGDGGGVPPWGYLVDDSYTGGTLYGERGDWLLDPAFLFSALYRDHACSDREAFWNYLWNPYVEEVRDTTAAAPWGGVDLGRRCDGTAEGFEAGEWTSADDRDSGVDTGDSGAADGASPAGEGKLGGGECGCDANRAPGWAGLAGVPLLLRRRRAARAPRAA